MKTPLSSSSSSHWKSIRNAPIIRFSLNYGCLSPFPYPVSHPQVHWNFPPISISMKRIATRAVTGSRPFNLTRSWFFFLLLRDGPSPKWKWKESAGLFQFPQPEFSVFSPYLTLCRFSDWSYFITFFAAQFCFGFVCALFVCARVVYFMLLYFIPACLTGLMGIFRLFLVETRGRSFPSLVEWLKVRRIGLGGVGF